MLEFNHIGTFAEGSNTDASGLSSSALHIVGGQRILYTLSMSETVQVVAYSVSSTGVLTQIDTQSLPYNPTTNPMPALSLSTGTNGTTLRVTGLGDGQLHELALSGSGTIQSTSASNATESGVTFGTSANVTAESSPFHYAIDPNTGQFHLWSIDAQGAVAQPLANAVSNTQVFQTAIASADLGNATVVLSLAARENALVSHMVSASGEISQVDLWSPDKGLWVSRPTAVEIVTVGGSQFGVIASAGSSSLTVMKIAPDGTLSITDQLIDSLNTRFDQAQVLGVTEHNGRAFVAAAGADDGITVFELLLNGQLYPLATLADQTNMTLDNVSSLDLSFHNGQLNVFVGSQTEVGVTALSLPNSDNGMRLWGTENTDLVYGSAGDDILIDSGGADTFWGGAGEDVFVFIADEESNVIRDFDPTEDRIDLSGWAFLRSLDQVEFVERHNGASVNFGDQSLRIINNDKSPLTYETFLATTDIVGSRMSPSWTLPDIEPDDNTPPPPPSGLHTMTGTPSSDSLTGTLSDDVILLLADNDTASGLDGADHIYGDLGNDVINGNAGSDFLYGGAGGDTINGGIGWDSILGGDGNDILRANDGFDTVAGGTGDDSIWGNNGNDTLFGQYGDDVIYGGLSADKLYGGDGNDSLFAGNGADQVFGDDGNDFLKGNAGFDTLYGGDGDDILYGGLSHDTLFGDKGNDTLYAENGADTVFGGTGDDDLFGNAGFDTIFGGEGNDFLSGGLQDDTLFGDDGNDWLEGNEGRDILDGGSGNDDLFGGGGDDEFIFNGGADTIHDFTSGRDELLLDSSLWGGSALSQNALMTYQTSSAHGTVQYDFGDGHILTVIGVNSTADLFSDIDFI